MRAAILTPALTLVLLAVAAPAAARDKVPDAVPTGPAVDCVSLAQLRESRVRSDTVIDFVTSGRRAYRVTLPQRCPGLGFEQRFGYATSLSQLCSTDIITVFSTAPVMRGASCGLAPFQPVTLAK